MSYRDSYPPSPFKTDNMNFIRIFKRCVCLDTEVESVQRRVRSAEHASGIEHVTLAGTSRTGFR